MIEEKKYSTRNTQIACFLATAGLQLVGHTKTTKGVFFEFTPEDKAKELVTQYFADKARVNPRELFSWLDNLRDLIFSTEEEVKEND
ncbi:hypothetical protein A2773_03320 [Candidatus Gottesmanbacteria bacterium RIFCSPHIGHO2_01_FULL_39_10]|uniref:DUF5659 domain-containing protein n=1 Tax=Candidatus Gottesmanbacteria bacterium RIFCSPHIGHO2_01_FULL_39_10 TaxID=1798375 RepID=A0A1F5ZN50_9BACT|nr:MAG: hypothetical protein A2773_03320 [Candidatus Gottesmanbacteria bacterium RIFCSPHIGHO2_01_FULL_39_10]